MYVVAHGGKPEKSIKDQIESQKLVMGQQFQMIAERFRQKKGRKPRG